MTDVNIIFITLNTKDDFFLNLREYISTNFDTHYMSLGVQEKCYDIENIENIDFAKNQKATYIVILHLDKESCDLLKSKPSESDAFLLKIYSKSSQLLILSHGGCQALANTNNYRHEFICNEYEDVKEGIKYCYEYLSCTVSENTIHDEFLQKKKETDNIKEIITFLAAMPKEISDEQIYLKKRRTRFTLFAGIFLSLGGLIAFTLIVNLLCENKLSLPSITNTPQYFAYALAFGFPIAMAFLFYRQANVKSKEIEKINEKSILVQQVENALNSYNVLLSGAELKDKTISSIDRVINKIFDNNHKEEKTEKTEESKLTISDVQKLFKIENDISKP